MASRRTLTAVTLTVLVAMLAVGAFIGWRALFAPLPGDSDAASGNRVASFARRITSRYGSAGLTITTSAPSSMSARISRSASSAFAGSCW